MRLRLFAAVLLAPLIVGGCDRNPIGSGAPLVGEWQSDALQFLGTAPNGSTNLLRRERWSFQSDGTYSRFDLVTDAATGHTWVLTAQKGSWRAGDTELRLIVRETFYEPADIPEVPVLTPVDPYVVRAHYELNGPTLMIEPICPPNALCVPPVPLHRMPELF
jgi:hypothetical protein